MPEEFNINEVVASFVTQNISNLVERGVGVYKKTADTIRLKLESTYKVYLENVLKRHSYVKTFFHKADPEYLYNFYIPLSVKHSRGLLEKPSISDLAKLSKHLVITGTAGSGKSVFLKHLVVSSVLSKFHVPVVLELRNYNDYEKDLKSLIFDVLAINKFSFDAEYVEKALLDGHFAIILDGLDEVNPDRKSELVKEIQEFTAKYDGNMVIVSSRPDQKLESWSGFTSLHLQPLTLELAHKLVEKLPYDSELKKKFLADLRKGLFLKHKSFLSNPLLLSIMVLTYGQNAHIPNKLNLFYNQAYEALFEIHDARKGGYRRKRQTQLDIQEFAKVFSAFCLFTYDQRKFRFSKTEAIEILKKAEQLTNIKLTPSCYLEDAIHAVCLLVEDGLQITFPHRSFQEYFAAKFICDSSPEKQTKLIEKFSLSLRADNVIYLVWEINPEILERNLILPKLQELFQAIGVKKTISLGQYLKYIKRVYKEFTIHDEQLGGSHSSPMRLAETELLYFCMVNYGDVFKWPGFDKDTRIVELFGKARANVSYSTANLKKNSPFLVELSKGDHFFSLSMLELVLKIEGYLKDRFKKMNESLDEILSEPPPKRRFYFNEEDVTD